MQKTTTSTTHINDVNNINNNINNNITSNIIIDDDNDDENDNDNDNNKEAFNKVESTIFRCAVSTSFFSVFLLLLLRALALFPRLCKSPYTLSALIVCALSVRVYALPLPARSTLILFPWVTGSYDYDFLCLEMLWILLVWNFVCFTFCL